MLIAETLAELGGRLVALWSWVAHLRLAELLDKLLALCCKLVLTLRVLRLSLLLQHAAAEHLLQILIGHLGGLPHVVGACPEVRLRPLVLVARIFLDGLVLRSLIQVFLKHLGRDHVRQIVEVDFAIVGLLHLLMLLMLGE